MHKYTPEEEKDIIERVEKANELLKELYLQPSASVGKKNLGDDTFVDQVIPYLQDIKYIKSPISDEITKKN